MDTDVIIVGAGYSGLAAAQSLTAAGARTIVLEASDRVGGRAQTDRSGLAPIDLGGQWIGPDQTRITAHAAALGLDTYRSHDTGTDVLVDRGRPHRLTPLRIALGAPAALTAVPALLKLHHWSTHDIDPSDAAALDRETLGTWLLRSIPSARMRRIITAVARDVFCREPHEVSVLALIEAIRGSGGLTTLVGFEGGSQQDLFVDGADRIPHLWAEHTDVRTDEAVVAIETTTNGVTVRTQRGTALTARHVIVAVPPAQVCAIAFTPALPATRTSMLKRLTMGRVVKAFAIYDRPFWRDEGLSGSILMTTGPASLIADVSPPGGPGHLCVLAAGGDGDRLAAMSATKRRQAIIGILHRALGAQAASPTRWVEKIWKDEPWIGGGYSAVPEIGALSEALSRQPVATPHISWAGTDTTIDWWGYFEGAIRTGERAATETLAAL